MPDAPAILSVVPMIPGGDDVSKSLDYYVNMLGFARRFHHGEPIELAGIACGGVELLLYRNGDKHLAENTSYRVKVEGVDALHAEFVGRGAAIHPDGAIHDTDWGTREFSMIDPAGVCIAFFEARG